MLTGEDIISAEIAAEGSGTDTEMIRGRFMDLLYSNIRIKEDGSEVDEEAGKECRQDLLKVILLST